jgi:hypothetical protein
VIPARDEIKGKVPDLYVSLKPGQQPSEEIRKRVENSVIREIGPLPARAVHQISRNGSYDAANAFGTPLRLTSECTYDAIRADGLKNVNEHTVRVDSKTYIDYLGDSVRPPAIHVSPCMPLGPSAAGIFSKRYAPMLVAPQEHRGREPRCSPVAGFYFNPRGTRDLSFSGHQKQRKICCRSNPSTSAPVVLSGAAFLSRDRAPIRLRRDARGGHEGIREELAATFIKRRKSCPHLFHLPGGR